MAIIGKQQTVLSPSVQTMPSKRSSPNSSRSGISGKTEPRMPVSGTTEGASQGGHHVVLKQQSLGDNHVYPGRSLTSMST